MTHSPRSSPAPRHQNHRARPQSRIVEDIRDGIDTASILHLVDGMQSGNSRQCEPRSVPDDEDDFIPF
jgi:hypothetical protein